MTEHDEENRVLLDLDRRAFGRLIEGLLALGYIGSGQPIPENLRTAAVNHQDENGALFEHLRAIYDGTDDEEPPTGATH